MLHKASILSFFLSITEMSSSCSSSAPTFIKSLCEGASVSVKQRAAHEQCALDPIYPDSDTCQRPLVRQYNALSAAASLRTGSQLFLFDLVS